MASEIRVPTLGESVTEATVAQWFKKPGDAVQADETLLELETDKVSLEVPAPASGMLAEVLVKEGDTVEVGALLGTLSDAAGEAAAPAETSEPAQAAQNEGASDEVVQTAASAPSSSPERDAPIVDVKSADEEGDLIDIIAPTAGESVSEADIAEWLVKVGEEVQVDQDLVTLETDKAAQDIPSPVAGVLAEILHEAGATVSPGDVLGRLRPGAHADAAPTQASAAPAASGGDDVQAPSVRRIAAESGIDPNSVEGTGKDGRVTKGDMLNAQSSGGGSKQVHDSAPAKNEPKVAARAVSTPADGAREERVKMSRLRQTIARRLKDAQNQAAMLTTFNEVDMTEVMATRSKYKELFEKKHGVKLGFMSFFTKAVTNALKEIPAVNAEIDGTDIVYKHYCHIGVAVGTDKGLVVPVVRDADQMGLADIEKEIGNLGRKARDGDLSISDMQGGTFTISNGGVYGSLMSTPILNAPQSGILGMHTIQKRPMVVDGEIKIRPMMYLALSYDHRIVDGKEAVTFLVRVKEALEDPARMVLDL